MRFYYFTGLGYVAAIMRQGLTRGDVPLKLARLMGHSSTAMVFNVYGHVSDARKREAADRIGEALLGG